MKNLITPDKPLKAKIITTPLSEFAAELLKQNPNSISKKVKTKPEKITKETPNSDIHSLEDSWLIENVFYKEKTENYRLSKTLLPSATQDENVEKYVLAKQNNEFHSADMPLYYSIFKSLYNSPDSKQKEEARSFIQKSMGNWLGTLTSIQYTPSGKDTVIHNYKILNEEYSKEVDFIGPDREIISADKAVLESLLLTKDVDEVEEIFNWINQTSTWIWRVNSKPNNLIERVAGFDVNSVRAGLYCYRSLSVRGSFLGVCAVRHE